MKSTMNNVLHQSTLRVFNCITYFIKMLIISSIVLVVSQCKHDPETTGIPTPDGCDTTTVTFSGTVWPIIELNCFVCHSGTEPSGNFTLDDYYSVVIQVEDGKLFSAINHEPGISPMPLNAPKLSQCKIDQIRIWIENGTPNN